MPTAPSELGLRWVHPKEDPEWKQKIIKEFNLHPVTAQVLVSRGFSSLDAIHDFLYQQLPDLHDPQLLVEMDTAVDRICLALQKNEKIMIYGDNDVDGITGTALLTQFLRELGAETYFNLAGRNIQRNHYIVESLSDCQKNDCTLLISVDCGVTAVEEIRGMTSQGIDVIVTDHHEPAEELPLCTAILNPKVAGNKYPNLDITGVGVAFKLAHGLTNRLVSTGQISPNMIDLKTYLDLVTLGTVSDMGALQGENRIFVRYGLRQLRQKQRVGLGKLLDVCDIDASSITTIDIASRVAPRLNSLGRIDDPRKGVELLLLTDHTRADALATELDLNNIERQKIERTASSDTERFLAENPGVLEDKAVVLWSDQWHPGVIAIVATRISKQYNRPTVIIAIEGGVGKGSVRSIPQFSLMDNLKACSDLLINYGGHDVASGITIPVDNIQEFKKRFVQQANGILLEEDVQPKLYLDAAVDFPDLTFDFMESMSLLEPYGNENPPPVLFSDTRQAWPPKVIGKSHLKLYLEQKERILEGIGFGMRQRGKALRRKDLTLRVAFTPQVNTFHNKASIQLLLRDFQIM